MKPTYNFDEHKFDNFIVGYIGEALREKCLVGKLLQIAKYSSKLCTSNLYAI